MRQLLKILREGLGRTIVFIDWIFMPQKVQRTQVEQSKINKQTQTLKLYQFYACPFCIKTRRVIKQLNLSIEMRNAQSGRFRAELLEHGGRVQVPCLKITQDDKTQWMYESSNIITYLKQRFDS